MSDSPQNQTLPKDDHVVQDVDAEDQMNDSQDPSATGLGFDFEVKEQDRWLPIANGANANANGPEQGHAARAKRTSNMPGESSLPKRLAINESMQTSRSTSSEESKVAAENSKGVERAQEVDANIRNFAPVARIMKNALPENAKIAKEAKECMQECVSEFISFITSEASEKCHQEKRKTVNGEDILFAMTSLGFENYAEALKIYLSKYRDQNQNSRDNTIRTSSQDFAGSSAAAAGDFTTPHAQQPVGTFSSNEPNKPTDDQGFVYPNVQTGVPGEGTF
ncbi:hypothetical protein TD95_001865 [Thielaviopsis punctulata]|uniref:Transcription factor CBF/NF-Y/archaeal histone domain-containing protein n=1 Tax=Thielaviopsis punctulata TaxID=72032 RepID=A0A0F4ZEP1_9PEZI|nr:hypothetical protein TD95_001865 [Thielaviopsis punctulata]